MQIKLFHHALEKCTFINKWIATPYESFPESFINSVDWVLAHDAGTHSGCILFVYKTSKLKN